MGPFATKGAAVKCINP